MLQKRVRGIYLVLLIRCTAFDNWERAHFPSIDAERLLAGGCDRLMGAEVTDSFLLEHRVIEPDLNHLLDRGRTIHLRPKTMALLSQLAARRGELVSREALLEHVWNGDHVTEQVLSSAICELRRVLGDDARQQRLIETIPKRGYRLVADGQPSGVSERCGEEPSARASAAGASDRGALRLRRKRHQHFVRWPGGRVSHFIWATVALGVFLLGAVCGFAWHESRLGADEGNTRVVLEVVLSDEDAEQSGAVREIAEKVVRELASSSQFEIKHQQGFEPRIQVVLNRGETVGGEAAEDHAAETDHGGSEKDGSVESLVDEAGAMRY